ncbi:MAG: helix-turn-helix transcriptional regulator [Vicinamibacterales bacterium]
MAYPLELHVESLTAREHQMAHAVSRGLRNRQIAAEFGISEETVKKHLATIYDKLGLSGRVELAIHVLQSRRNVDDGATPDQRPASL